MKRILKKLAALAASAVMLLTVSGCGDEKVTGNLGDVSLGDNDVYAVISIKDYGDITAKLFPEAAPKSVEHFIEFAERGYYDNRTIHRVIKDYMIQGGSLNGDGSDGTIPDSQYVEVEVSKAAYNFYGALCFAAAKKGSYAQFYIVDNSEPQDIDAIIEKISGQLGNEEISARLLPEDKKYYEDYLKKLKEIPEEVKEKYAKVGGLYELDGQNTVFGQVIEGFNVLEAIASVEVVTGNKIDDKQGIASKPLDTIVIDTVKIIRLKTEETEATTTKKGSGKSTKSTTTSEVINAETLPALPAATTAGEGGESADTTVSPDAQADETGDITADMTGEPVTPSTVDEAFETEPGETAATDEAVMVEDTEGAAGSDTGDDEIVVVEN